MPKQVPIAIRVGKSIWRGGRWVWKNQEQIEIAVGKVGPALIKSVGKGVEAFKHPRFCREDEKHVIDNPLAENKWIIARNGERCRICTRKTDPFGNPIPETERKT
jgi:hypothetical protein